MFSSIYFLDDKTITYQRYTNTSKTKIISSFIKNSLILDSPYRESLRNQNRTLFQSTHHLMIIALGYTFLLFIGDTNLIASLDGENDLLNFAAVDSFCDLLHTLVGEIEALGDFLQKLPFLVGERNA